MSTNEMVVVRREIAAPAEALFDAWLDARSLEAWMLPGGDVRETQAEVDPRVGGDFRITMITEDGTSLLHTGTYEEIDRPRRLAFTWSSAATRHRATAVTVTFTPKSSSTVVEIRHADLPDDAERRGHDEGWSNALGHLAHIHERST